MATPFLISGEASPRAPITSVTVSAATWRGTSMSQRAFATLRTQTFQGRGNGRFSLLDGGGPRVGAAKGIIDAHFRMGTGADTVVLVQSTYSSTTSPLITLGVNASGQAVGSIQDISGTTVAAWAATAHNAVAATGAIHLQLAWDASTPIDGGFHVWLTANGQVMPQSSFTTAPVSAWVPFQGLYLTTGKFCETGFDGEMLFTQASALAPEFIRTQPRPVEVEPATLTLPAPLLQLSGAITPVAAVGGSVTLPSLQLSGALSLSVSLAASSITLPSNTLGGALTVAVNKISAWLRLASSSQSGGEWTPSIVDILNPGSPVTQTDTDRRTAVGTTSNGLPTMVFDGTDVHIWPATAANYATTKLGYWLWIKPAVASGVQRLLNIPANGASIQLYASGSQLQCEVYIGAGGRFGVTASGTLVAGAWQSVYLQYDSSRGGDANLAIYVNGVAKSLTYGNLGAGGTLGALSPVVGNIILGAFNDSDTPTQGIADGGELGPNLYVLNDNLNSTEIAQLQAYETPVFSPTELTAISAWLRLAGGTITGSGYSSVPDTLASNPAVQTNNAQRPVNGTSVNSLPIANFVTANATCWQWPTATNTNQALTTKAGFAGWFKFTTYTGIFKCIFEIGGSTGAYDNSKFEVYIDSSRRVNVYHFGTDTVGYNGRTAVSPFNSVPAANNWFFLRWQFNGGSGTEALRCRTFINEVEVTNTFANVGSGGAPLTLRTTGPNIPSVFGSFGTNDNTYAIAGACGPNIYLIKDDLTVAQGASLMAYERPT